MFCAALLLSVFLAAGERPEDRPESLRALCAHLGVGPGSAVGDVGGGRGRDTWVFAEIVGAEGRVFSEEIEEDKVEAVKKDAEERKLGQVRAILGTTTDPCLPEKGVDLIYLHRVYHHFAEPRPMLRSMWRALRPGGFLAVVDQHRGTLRDWVPREERARRHFFIAETTVVREAREEGYAFLECAESCWHEPAPFVLIFQRPPGCDGPAGDPDPFPPLERSLSASLILPLGGAYARTAFCALGEGRALVPAVAGSTSSPPLEVVLEEWATRKDERPPVPPGLEFPAVLTENGDPRLPPEPLEAFFFLDAYHLLFHGETLLGKILESLAPAGSVLVVDRESPIALSRREASHRRAIRPEQVVEEMGKAGFHLWASGPRPAPDRFALLFGKAPSGALDPAVDPCIAGPSIPGEPGAWLAARAWRLRGMRAAGGRVVRFAAPLHAAAIVRAPAPRSGCRRGTEVFWIPSEGCRLFFSREAEGYQLIDVEGGG